MPMHAPPAESTGLVDQTRETVVDSAQSAVATVEETVDNYPLSTALVVFGAGLGAGVLIGCALADSARPHLGLARSRPGNSAEAFGQKVMDNIAAIMPDAIANHLNR